MCVCGNVKTKNIKLASQTNQIYNVIQLLRIFMHVRTTGQMVDIWHKCLPTMQLAASCWHAQNFAKRATNIASRNEIWVSLNMNDKKSRKREVVFVRHKNPVEGNHKNVNYPHVLTRLIASPLIRGKLEMWVRFVRSST